MKSKHIMSVLLMLFLIVGCSSKKKNITDLVASKKYTEAQSLIDSLSEKDRESPEIKKAQAVINFANILEKAKKLRTFHSYEGVDTVIDKNVSRFAAYPSLEDSLKDLRKQYAFEGASEYENLFPSIAAYNCVKDYVNDKTLTGSQVNLINTVRERAINGLWYGKMLKRRVNVEMRIEALSPSVFTGRVFFRELGILCEFHDGRFDGKTLTATYAIQVSPYRQVMGGVVGKFDRGAFIMTFPVVVNVTQTEDYGYGEAESGYSKIMKLKCIMTKRD